MLDWLNATLQTESLGVGSPRMPCARGLVRETAAQRGLQVSRERDPNEHFSYSKALPYATWIYTALDGGKRPETLIHSLNSHRLACKEWI